MQIPRPIARIALASTAVVALALTSASAATAAPIEVNVCADSNVFVPVGTDFILDFSACEADLTSGPDLDLYDADSIYSAGGSLTLVDGKTPLTFTQTMNYV